ncbi:MAG: hypothetical protein WBG42_14785 [Cryomorphaceae bacterium]
MGIALSTLILFFILIPGIAFRRFYYSEEFSKEYFKESFFGVFFSTLIPSILFHISWFFLAKIFGYNVSLYVLADIVSQSPSIESFSNFQQNSGKILVYNLSMFFVAGLSGYYLKNFIRSKKWDRSFKFFRFQNSWHYILKGEFFDFPRAEFSLERDTVEEIEFVFVDAVLELNTEAYLYDGILVDYELRNDGGLETISLKNSQRRKLSHDNTPNSEKNGSRYYPIEGHILVLKYHEVKNLNFTYLCLEKVEDGYRPRQVR